MQRFIFWLITFAAILGACFTFQADPMPREYAHIMPPVNLLDSPDAIAAGREIFAQNCAACHGRAGDGRGVTNPAFGPKPANLTDPVRAANYSPQYLFWRVSEGGRVEPYRSQGSIMPAWKYQLRAEQRWQLVAYVSSIAR